MVALLTDPNAAPPEGLPINRQAGARSPIEVIVPAHLQDLKEGDLPEEQRVAVLDQIAIFRENAARREREKKALEDEKDRFNNSQRGPTSPATSRVHASANYGYGNRGMEKENQRKWGAQQSQSPRENGGPSQREQRDQRDHRDQRENRDPQGYDKPVNFVRPELAEAKDESERTDEEEEELREKRRRRDRDQQLRDVSDLSMLSTHRLTHWVARTSCRKSRTASYRKYQPGAGTSQTARRVRRPESTASDRAIGGLGR